MRICRIQPGLSTTTTKSTTTATGPALSTSATTTTAGLGHDRSSRRAHQCDTGDC